MNGTRVFESLNAEWAVVCAEPGHTEMVLGWLREGGVHFGDREVEGGLSEVLAELGRRDRTQDRGHSDRWLRVLLERAVGEGAGALLAARVIVQAMVPGAMRLTRRLQAGRDYDETGRVVVACLFQVVRRFPLGRTSGAAANLLLETLHLASRELKAESAEGGVVQYPYLDAVLSGEPADDDPAQSAWAGVLERRAARAGLLRDGEGVDGARGELVELLVWAVGAGQMDADRARVIADETRVGAQAGAGVSAVAWRKRRSRTVRQMRVVAERWVQAA
ncbi:hypothetical protein [Streptomyces drozdowiczii]|uniref:Uncharacterized protein n=1 Tax=Streptomyces drozdowiczii TaxID=202862 RepID=A0ABY6PKM4_9ACTN|nr:hypothetical protein [Streptomyces drozdowiczii]MCX0247866.1 hypothetical protein [Streptomyces drozdowiczii]UZK52775.1 hypothetical protein NEH16_00420 [Streptomyces drozdowiczii]